MGPGPSGEVHSQFSHAHSNRVSSPTPMLWGGAVSPMCRRAAFPCQGIWVSSYYSVHQGVGPAFPGPVKGRTGSDWPSYFNCRPSVVTRVTDISRDRSCSRITDPDMALGSNWGPMSPWPHVASKLPVSSCSSLPSLPLVSLSTAHRPFHLFSFISPPHVCSS